VSAHVVRLVVLPVEALTDASQAFRCDPFSAVIPARTCVARRRSTYYGGRNQHAPPTIAPEFVSCARCELGARVEAAVAEVRTDERCSVEGCTEVVHGARGRRPVCPRHRKNAVLGSLLRGLQ
jgi:hypothetical protein